MARGVLSKIAADRGINIEIRTAGLAHHPKQGVAANALTVMQELGIDISDDYSKPVTADALKWADLILPLSQNLKEHLLEDHLELASRLRCLVKDVRDPYGGSIADYRGVRDTLQGLLSEFVLTLT
jgi:protein-tyrosine-phosphatase